MGAHYAELLEQADTVDMWLRTEEEAFNRTLESGLKMLDDVIAKARDNGAEGIGADEAFKLHDTFGFPFDLTLELAAERGLGVDEQGFESLMEEQRVRARASAGREGGEDAREKLRAFASRPRAIRRSSPATRRPSRRPRSRRSRSRTAALLAKLVESPFYATGGGQVHDGGVIECEDGGCSAKVVDVVRLGDDQALVLEPLDGRAARRRARVRARRSPRAPRDRVQPHRDAPPARRAARAARHARAPGGLLRRPGQAALRLHARRAAERRGPPVGRGPRERDGAREPARARADDDARRGQEPRRDGAVRREVRRRRADGRGRRRRLVARAVRRHARALDRRDRRLQDHAGDLQRRQRAPDRGDHRPARRRAAAQARPRPARRRRRPAHAAGRGRRRRRGRGRQAPRAREAAGAAARPRRSRPSRPRSSRSTASARCSRSARSRTRRRCPTWPIA